MCFASKSSDLINTHAGSKCYCLLGDGCSNVQLSKKFSSFF